MADVIVNRLNDVTGLPEDTHWFCPREGGSEDQSLYFDEDVGDRLADESEADKETRTSKIEEARNRKKDALVACQILAFDGSDAQVLQNQLNEGLKRQLTRCTVCVREFHRGRAELKQTLEETYDVDEVTSFLERFDQMNIGRISHGLQSAVQTLRQLNPSQRTLAALQETEMYALFEAMHCTAFLRDEELLANYFDEPFHLVQTKKKISLPDYTPALTSFLFSHNTDRRAWALRGWGKFKRNITAAEFDWTVRETLNKAMARVNIVNLDRNLLPLFWPAARVIVEKLSKELITHHLRAMDVDIYRLALEHLQLDLDSFLDLTGTMQLLLEKSPADFWDALGTIPPQTVVEEIFKNPYLKRSMTATDEQQPSQLDSMLTWIDPFINSIKASNLTPATRSLADKLMTQYQEDKYSQQARAVCWKRGLQVLTRALQTLDMARNVGGATVSDMLEVVRQPIFEILKRREESQRDALSTEANEMGLDVIKCALSLDCHSLQLDKDAISQKKSLGHELGVSSLAIWKAAARHVRSGDIALPIRVLTGARRLLVLGEFPSKQVSNLGKVAESWNNALQRITGYIVELLEALQDFEPRDFETMLNSRDSALGFFGVLFSGDDRVRQAASTVMKTITSEGSRREGIRYILETFYSSSLAATAQVLRWIAHNRVFAPCRTVLKVGMDILTSLCDSSDGILRSKNLSAEDVTATENIWQALWQTIGVMFEMTENWSNLGFDKSVLMEFCKETMEFADEAFDQYSVLAGALRDAEGSSEDQAALEKRLLKVPREAAGHGTKWLRLRDEYLIQRAVSFTVRIMARLRDADIELPEESTLFVEDVAIGNKTRTKLTEGQKAELRRALENHLGQTMSESPDVEEVSKPQKQGLLSGWVTNAPSTTTTITAPKPKQGIDLDKWKSSAAAQRKNLDAASDSSLKKAISAASPTAEMLKAKGGLPARGSLGPATKRAAQNAQMDANEFRRKRMEEQEAMRKRNLAIIAAQKGGAVGAGSGVQGLGVAGKDHSTKGQGVMVSSDEESSEDEEGGLDAELFGGKQLKRSSDVRNKAAGAVGLKPEVKKGPVKLQRQVRSAKDMRARLAPDLTPLHKAILSWDFFHEGDFPPNSNEYQYKGVSNSFRHVGEYQGTFQPLLLLEAWQGFVKNREENTFKPYEIKIVNRSSVDAFIELSSSMAHADNREVQLSEGDIILVSKAQQPTADPKAPHCLARVYRIRRQKQHLEILYRVAPASSMMSSLTPGSLIYGTKIQSITPLEREYGALLGLQYYDLCDEIIKARPSPLLDYTEKQLQPLISNYTVNRAQAKAVKSAIDNDAFTLIQGPPGSGKTKTIVAIVGALLSDSLVDKQVGVRIEAPKPNGGFGSAQGPASKKLLVCAPSNAAVDELVMRFKDGIKTLKGVHKKVNVVRLGRSDAINTNVVDVTMDELVNQKLGQTNGDNDARQKTQQIMKEHQGVSEQLRLARAQLDAGEAKGEELSKLQEDFQLLKKRKAQLGTQIDNAKDAENAASRNAELNRKRVQQAVLDEAHIICATLSGSGHEMFQGLNIEFETVVVDEAAQCVEMSALIPLKYGCAKCILVGDPKQLPPTVFSKEAARFQYEQSLFVRMQSNFPDAVHLLDTQYRMHPDISAFPSATFYDGRLLDGDDMAGLRKRPWHSSSLLAPYRFFDVRGQHQAAPKGHSLINLAEIEVAIALYERLVKDYNSFDFSSKVGIITPYKSQLRELKERFARHFGNTIIEKVEFNTTDAFQGRESEVIIFSCVRASPAGGIGFLQDIRRMNVGLTRAKSSLWVLGNSESLMRGEYWKKLVVDAKDRGTYTTGDLMSMLRQHSSNFPAKPSNVVKKSAKSVQNGFSSDNAVSDGRAASISSTGSGRSTPVYQDPTARVKEEIRVKEEARIKDEERSSPIPMEGVRVKLEDKLAKMRSTPDTASSRSSVPPKIDVDEQDVEMEDAYSESRSGTLTLQNGLVKPETGEAKPATAPKTQDATRPRASMPAKPAQPAIMRKRKPADPFMPKKQQKRA